MCLLIETGRVQHGELLRLAYHQARLDAARAHFFPHAPYLSLVELLQVPPAFSSGSYRCRLLYGEGIEQVDFTPLVKRQFRKLKVVHAKADFNYSYKLADRRGLNELLAQKGGADEVIIARENRITDSSIGNLVFRKNGEFFTPKEPLLLGTQRTYLLQQGLLQEKEILLAHLPSFEAVGIINALIDWKEIAWVDIQDVNMS